MDVPSLLDASSGLCSKAISLSDPVITDLLNGTKNKDGKNSVKTINHSVMLALSKAARQSSVVPSQHPHCGVEGNGVRASASQSPC